MDSGIYSLIQKISSNVFEAKKPCECYFGIVRSVGPLTIFVEQKILLEEPDLILTNAVKDHYVDITVNHLTDTYSGDWDTTHSHPDAGSGSIPQDHIHSYTGKKKIMVHNGLKVGEKVILLMVARGQKFIVLDRITDHICEGQWGE